VVVKRLIFGLLACISWCTVTNGAVNGKGHLKLVDSPWLSDAAVSNKIRLYESKSLISGIKIKILVQDPFGENPKVLGFEMARKWPLRALPLFNERLTLTDIEDVKWINGSPESPQTVSRSEPTEISSPILRIQTKSMVGISDHWFGILYFDLGKKQIFQPLTETGSSRYGYRLNPPIFFGRLKDTEIKLPLDSNRPFQKNSKQRFCSKALTLVKY
jgi:hypothetical protein